MTYQARMSAGWQQRVGLYDEQDGTWWTAIGWDRNSAEHTIKRVAFKSWAVAGCQPSCKARPSIRVLVRHYGWKSTHVSKAVQEIMDRLP